jgi:peptidoglycan/xylan/chitin deacetylase (PgdA/CDA1 family)
MGQRLILKRRIARLYRLLCACNEHRKLVLLYHSIGSSAEATPIHTFRGHLEVIAKVGQLLPLRTVLSSAPKHAITVAITFDDGYASLREAVSDILAEFGCAATVFLNVGEIAEDERRSSKADDGFYPHEQFLSWLDVEALIAADWRIGSHGVRHLDLVRANRSVTANEICASKAAIERRLGGCCDMFAYPWGRSDPQLRSQVRMAGYRYGFGAGHSPLTAKSDPLALPRINVAKEYSPDDLAAILRGDWDYLWWVAKARGTAFNGFSNRSWGALGR